MDWLIQLLKAFLGSKVVEPQIEEPKTEEKPNEIIGLEPVSVPEGRKINDKGLELLKNSEGCKLTAYRDSVGVLTIGYGSTGSHVSEGMSISQDEAEELLRKDLSRFEKGIASDVSVTLSDDQFSALVVFSFNVGLHSFHTSTLRKKLNAGDYDGAANEFLRWNKAGGQVLKGLTIRRQKEKELFQSS